MPKTTIASFLLRFTQELDPDPRITTPWRAVIRHVQSDEEVHFTTIERALAFIGEYVDLDNETAQGDDGRERGPGQR